LDISLGLKLVRGAYILEEREVAKKKNKESPCWETMDQTHKCYNSNLTHIMSNFRKDQDAIVIASHNVESCELGYELMNEFNLLHANIIFG